MKIKRFFAPDMRQAIRSVRETLGADAVILSNRSVEGGVELVAAIDFDPEALQQDAAPAADTPPQDREKPSPRKPKTTQAPATVEWSQEPVLVEMRQEMRALRRMMENELCELAWHDLGARRPGEQELLRRLMQLGLAPEVAKDLAARSGEFEDVEQAWRKALYFLAQQIPTFTEDATEQGGIVAVLGPTGVGKTTTIAKLAARFCVRHGNRHVALVTTDNYRIGAREQLHTYGRILNVPVKSAADEHELEQVLDQLANRRLVLIDTAGMGTRDLRLAARMAVLEGGGHRVRRLLALAATTERAALERSLKVFADARPEACIVTKIDEAASLGSLISSVIRARLPIAYLADGQRVPEDLQLARANTLVGHAAQLAAEAAEPPSEAYLALSMRGTPAHAHV